MSSGKPHICVVGAGTMGRGIAQVALGAGHRVSLVDPSESQLRASVDEIIARLTRNVPETRADVTSRLSTFDALTAVPREDDLVLIEAAVEDLAVKQAIFREAQAHFGTRCVLATNTSSLSITEIAAAVEEPSRVVGMHFFNPVPVMRLVEVVDGLQTDPEVGAAVAELARSWGKEVARVRSAPGFIVNRVARPFYGEALRLLEEGAATAEIIDEVLRSAGGFRMGPFELMDLIGLEVNLTVTRTVWAAFNYDPRFAPSRIQTELVAAGRLGRKTGHGFYRYGDGSTRQIPAPARADRTPPGPLRLVGVSPELATILERADLKVERTDAASMEPGRLELGSLGAVMVTRGRTAAEESAEIGGPVVVVDRCLDPTATSALTLAGTSDELVSAAVALLDRAGIRSYPIADTPGLIVARIVAMLANEAWETAHHGTATPEDIDTAMRLGTNYPLGPFEWANRWGLGTVLQVLDALWSNYRDSRYRASLRLRNAVRTSQASQLVTNRA